jgi:hypothetical protein
MTSWACEKRGNLINQIFPNTPVNDTNLIDNENGYIMNTPEQQQKAIDIRNKIWDAVKRGRK